MAAKPSHTPARSIRVEPALWTDAKAIAEARGETLTAVINACLRRYVQRHR